MIIDNTHMQAWEAYPYVAMALAAGYGIRIQEPQTPWWVARDVAALDQRNTHGRRMHFLMSFPHFRLRTHGKPWD